MEDKKHIVALEIGSSHIAGVVASVSQPGDASIVCYHEVPIVDCVRYGNIVNVDEVCNKVSDLLHRITGDGRMAPRQIDGVYLAVGGRSLHTQAVEIDRDLNENAPVSREFIEMLKREVEAGFDTKNIVEVLPREYELDGNAVNPIGSVGSRLHAVMNVLLCRPQTRRNLQMVFDRLQLRINGFVTTPIAATQTLLSSDERRLGCVYVDHGAETTTVAIYKDNRLMYLNVLPMGSRNITRDLCSLNLIEEQADKIKRNYGDAMSVGIDLPNTDIGGVSALDVSNYVSARAGEIMENVYNQLQLAKMTADQLPAGFIVTGRGMKLRRMTELLKSISNMKVRMAQYPGIDEGKELSKIPQLLSVVEWIANQPTCANCTSMPQMPEHPDANDDVTPVVEKPVREEPKPKKPKKPSKWQSFFDRLKGGIDETFDDPDE